MSETKQYIVEKTSMGVCPAQDTVEAASPEEAVYYWMEQNMTLPHNVALQPITSKSNYPGWQEFIISISPAIEEVTND